MTSVSSQHVVSHSTHNNSGPNLDNHLDALLDDLQSGVGHRGEVIPHNGTLVNGSRVNLPAGASGYREVTTTVTQERNGVPTTSRDYQIEYLNPANSVTVLSERANSPIAPLLRNIDTTGAQVASYKTSSYNYQFSEKTTDGKGAPIRPEQNYSVNKVENVREGNALNKNLNELDVLLHELNTAQRTPNPPRRTEQSSRSIESRIQSSREYPQSSTPRSASLTRDAQREFQQYSEVQAPGTPRAPQRGLNVNREVHTIEQRSHTSRRDSPGGRDRSVELSPTLRRRTPSPTGEFRPATFSSYPISPYDLQQQQTTRSSSRGRSQTRWEETESSQTQQESKYRTNYTSHASTARSDDPAPYRSPSPVSFPQHPGGRSPSPVRKSVSRSNSGRTLTYQVSPQSNANAPANYTPARQLDGQPPLSDPSSPTVITYKYSSHSQQTSKYPGSSYDDHTGPRPFPTHTPQPHPGDQNPPKKLDELMASFHDTNRTYTSSEQYYRELNEQQRQHDLQRSPSFERNIRPSNVKATQVYHQPQQPPQPVHEFVPPPSPPAQRNQHLQQRHQEQNQQLSKSVAGPPVYYPPGVELFAKKEQVYEQQQSASGKGGKWAKGKAKYKYEAGEKSKEKSSTKKAVVPVCLPLCCAMPCSIM